MSKIDDLLRKHLKDFTPYSTARDDFKGDKGIFLDANENSLGSVISEKWNRYPDPRQGHLKRAMGTIKGIAPECIFMGNGSDEPIDLLIRAFCEPGIDEVMIFPPTYGMYKVAANINNVSVKEVLLTPDFQLDMDQIKSALNDQVKIMFICSPNNPTGNLIQVQDVLDLAKVFQGIIVIDEAYIDFTDTPSWIQAIPKFPHLVVLQTLSKAWGLASLRLGMAFCDSKMVDVLNLIKSPYNISGPVQNRVLRALKQEDQMRSFVEEIKVLKNQLHLALEQLPNVLKVYPSDANFFLVKFTAVHEVFDYLIGNEIILRNRSGLALCKDCLRITVGTAFENEQLILVLNNYLKI
tara:strand:- start:69 stop:1121 length:1053 start_codon:yes stop_codon:yes gene_type:complete